MSRALLLVALLIAVPLAVPSPAAAGGFSTPAVATGTPDLPDDAPGPLWRVMALQLDGAYDAKRVVAECLAKNPPPSEVCVTQAMQFMDSLDALYASLTALKIEAAEAQARTASR